MKIKKNISKKRKENKILQNIFKKLVKFTNTKILLESLKINNPVVEKNQQKKKNLKNKFLFYFRNKNKKQIKKSLSKKIDKFLRTANRIIGYNEEFLKKIEMKKLFNFIFEEIKFDLKNLENEKKLYNFKNLNLKKEKEKNLRNKEKNPKQILEEENNSEIIKLNDFDLNYAFWELNIDKNKPNFINDREIYVISKCINFLVELKNTNSQKNNFNSEKKNYFESEKLRITNDNIENDIYEEKKLKKRILKIEYQNKINLKKKKDLIIHKNFLEKKEILTKNVNLKLKKNEDFKNTDNDNSEENINFLKKLNFFYSYLDNKYDQK